MGASSLARFLRYQALDSTTHCTTKKKPPHQGWIPQPLDHQKQAWIPHPWITKPVVDTPTLGSNTGVDIPPLGHQASGGCPYPWSPKPGVDTPTLGSPQPDGERASG